MNVWNIVSLVGFMFFNFFIATSVIIVMINEVKNKGYMSDSLGVLLVFMFGVGWLYQTFQYHIRDEELNNLKKKLTETKKATNEQRKWQKI